MFINGSLTEHKVQRAMRNGQEGDSALQRSALSFPFVILNFRNTSPVTALLNLNDVSPQLFGQRMRSVFYSFYSYRMVVYQRYSIRVLQEFLKHAIPDCFVRGTDFFPLDCQIKE